MKRTQKAASALPEKQLTLLNWPFSYLSFISLSRSIIYGMEEHHVSAVFRNSAGVREEQCVVRKKILTFVSSASAGSFKVRSSCRPSFHAFIKLPTRCQCHKNFKCPIRAASTRRSNHDEPCVLPHISAACGRQTIQGRIRRGKQQLLAERCGTPGLRPVSLANLGPRWICSAVNVPGFG